MYVQCTLTLRTCQASAINPLSGLATAHVGTAARRAKPAAAIADIPAKILRGKRYVRLYLRLKRSKYEPYREAWNEMPGTSPKSGTVSSIEACAEKVSFLFSPVGFHGEGSPMELAGIYNR